MATKTYKNYTLDDGDYFALEQYLLAFGLDIREFRIEVHDGISIEQIEREIMTTDSENIFNYTERVRFHSSVKNPSKEIMVVCTISRYIKIITINSTHKLRFGKQFSRQISTEEKEQSLGSFMFNNFYNNVFNRG